VLELRNLRIRYGEGSNALFAVDGVSLAAAAPASLGIVGESGCGKSTLARGIVALVPIYSGRILLDGKDCTPSAARDSAAFRHRVQMVFQDPYSTLNPRMTVGATLAEALRVQSHSETTRANRRDVAGLLKMVGLPDAAADKFPHQFSGGQRQRISIARALAVSPEVIILDEVTSALDVSVQATILNLLKELQRELRLCYVVISHDLSVIRYMCDEIAVMYMGQVVERAKTDELFTRPRHPYTESLLRSIPQLAETASGFVLAGETPDPRHPPSGCRFHTRCPIGPLFEPARTNCIEVDPQQLGSDTGGRFAACHYAGSRNVSSGTTTTSRTALG
jgi:oligopeptide/dipeptide ABC transporter ATP-binding protein